MNAQSTVASECSPDRWPREALVQHANLAARVLHPWRRLCSRNLLLFLGVVVLLTIAPSSTARTDDGLDISALAEDYVATLDKDLALQATFYSPNTRFRDPTSALFGPAWDITGGEKIIQFFKQASADSGTLVVDYKITHMLVEGPIVVANITSTVTACGVNLGFPEKSFTGDIHMVMVLRFEGSKLSQRTDYVGYSAAFQKMAQLAEKLPDQEDDLRCAESRTP